MTVTVIGAGPAGSAAAIAAIQHGAAATLREKSKFPRHKVCGEFLSPEIVPLMNELGVWRDIEAAQPARFRRLALHFPKQIKTAVFSDRPYGFSRYALDKLLLDRAVALGARLEPPSEDAASPRPLVLASGRHAATARDPKRVFGFKAHYTGPSTDTMELHFFDEGYVGVNGVEGGLTNVCGIATEALLQRHGFDPDSLISSVPSLRERLDPLARAMEWLRVGPLVYRNRWRQEAVPGIYLAGDELSFVDPFTGTGILSAVLTGSLAGRHAATGVSPANHMDACRSALRRAFVVASAFRAVLGTRWAPLLARFTPGSVLVRWTRPRVAATGSRR